VLILLFMTYFVVYASLGVSGHASVGPPMGVSGHISAGRLRTCAKIADCCDPSSTGILITIFVSHLA
jgi:hypothetical protein